MNDNFLKVAKQAALEAGKVISSYFGKNNKIQVKNNDASNLVTEVDLKSEKAIIGIISQYFPTHNIITEESRNIDQGSEYSWAVDPLDGTISFVHGLPHFSVTIGLMKNNQPILGVIYNVLSQELYSAQVGKGAYLNGKKIRVSQINKLEQAVLQLGMGSIKRRADKLDRYVNPLITKIGYPYAFGSASTAYTFVAKGALEATIDGGWIWDFVAGTVITQEAGGKVTDFTGNEPEWSKERLEVIASNGLIHDQILEVLK